MSSVIKVGRGGAGNYYGPEDLDREATRNAEDIEAQRSSKLKSDQNVTRPVPEYAYSGRGGSGNIYSPRELEEQGTFESPPAPKTDRVNSVGGFGGRGGAGNIRQRVEGDERGNPEAERNIQDAETRLKEKVTQEVEAGLPAPPQVHLGRR